MSIKLIVNGFFRSGTTIIWRIFRDGNPTLAVFYEPCHGEIFGRIEAERQSSDVDALHSMRVWSEYYERPELLEKLRWHHPNLGGQLPLANKTCEYIENFEVMDQDCILQPNRWHFVLSDLTSKFGMPALHIIRNPNDVYSSIVDNFFNLGSPIKRAAKRLVSFVNPGRPFNLDQMAATITDRYDAHDPYNPIKSRLQSRRKLFLKVWIRSNLQAIRSVGKENLIVYEDLLSRPDAYAAELLRRYDLQFPYANLLRSKQCEFLSHHDRRLLEKEVADLGMTDELTEILAAVDMASLAWPSK